MTSITNKFLLQLIILLTAAFTPSCFTQQPAETATEKTHVPEKEHPSATLETEILSIINKYRASKGLNPLTSNVIIAGQAEKHSADMASKRIPFSHDGFEIRVSNITKQLGAVRASAENVALGKLTARQVVELWLKSPGHRKNIEGKYLYTGIGLATANDGTIYFTQIFAA